MALCNPKTLRGLFGEARKLGLSIDDLRQLTSTGSLRLVEEAEAAELLARLREQGSGQAPRHPWRLYSASTLCREIWNYAALIKWKTEGGFNAWLKKYYHLERIEWVDSLQKAIAIKNALKRMYHEQAALKNAR